MNFFLLFMMSLMLVFSESYAEESGKFRLEAQLGQCKYGLAPEGIWWNDSYPTSIDRRNACFQLGVSRIEAKKDWADIGWRASYVDLGKLRADNQFAMRDDEQFEEFDPHRCDLATQRNCVGRGVISQQARGLLLAGLVERDFGGVRLGLDAGGYLYHGRFKVALIQQGTGKEIAHLDWSGWRITPSVGLTATYGVAFATIRGFGSVQAAEHNCGGCSGITMGPAWAAFIGVQIPLR